MNCPKCKRAGQRREPTDDLRQRGGSCPCGATWFDLITKKWITPK